MEADLYWLLTGRIIYWKLSGFVSMSALKRDLEQLIDSFDTTGGIIHILLDAREITKFKPDGTDVRPSLKQLAKHRTFGKLQTVTTNVKIQQKINRLTIDFGTRMLNSTSIDQAMQALKQADATLPVTLPEPVDLETLDNLLQPE
jgi:hypothetical protein